MSRALERTIFAGCRELGLDSDSRRDLQLMVTGKESLTEMTEADLRKVVSALKERGFRVSRGTKRPRASRADIRFCHVMWRLLNEAGEAKVPGAKGLNAFVQKRFAKKWGFAVIDIDALTEWEQIKDVVDALKDWCKRAGVDLDQ